MSVYRFISAEKARTPVSMACRLLGVSRSGYYGWLTRGPSNREVEDLELTDLIRDIWRRNRKVYGSPRVHAELGDEHGIHVGRKRVERLMRQAGISAVTVKKTRRTTIRVPGVRPAGDLANRNWTPEAPNRLWVADITYLRTWEGWQYLAAVQDTYSRRIVGWAMADHMRAELVVDALRMAVSRRRPEPGLIHHSDQGSQFVSLLFGQEARRHGIHRSMGSKGDCFDNSVAESFFATLKKELIHRYSWPTRGDQAREVIDYIEVFYNHQRRHSTLGMRSPSSYETLTQTTPDQTLINRP